MSTHSLFPFDDIADGEVRRVDVDGVAIAVVRIGDDVYAIGDTCSHQKVSLSGGLLEADALALECPKHGAGFCLETGRALTLPATKPVPAYAVTVTNGDVEVEIS